MARLSRRRPRPHLVSFGDARLVAAARRFRRQAKRFRAFSTVKVFDQTQLDSSFFQRNADLLSPEVRGFGYWLWKPQIVLQRLSELPHESILFYADVGFHINSRGRKRFWKWVAQFEESEEWVLAFQALPPRDFPEHDGRALPDLADKVWCKGDAARFFSMGDHPELQTPTIGAGLFAVKNTPPARKFLAQWLAVADQNRNLIDDSDSVFPNPPGFREHRHDQSLFSLFLKKYDLGLRLSAYEYWYPNKNGRGADWQALKTSPFLAKRDLGKKKNTFSRAMGCLRKIWWRRN